MGELEMADFSKYQRTYCPCDECPYGIERRDGSGNDSECKICEFAKLLNRHVAMENKPLTLDELRKICKERAPVWIAEKGNPNYGGYWQYAYDSSSGTMAFFTFGNEVEELYDTKNYGKTWLAYASKPKGEQD